MINYTLLYVDFITESSCFSEEEKTKLIHDIKVNTSNGVSYKHLMKLNHIIKERTSCNTIQKRYTGLKTYDKEYIISVLKHQNEFGLSNLEISKMFYLSRNTVARWRRVFGNV